MTDYDPDAALDNIYDRAGKPMTMGAYVTVFENSTPDNDYRRVAETTVSLPDGGSVWVSTVWLGYDHNFDGGRPLIFETMIFDDDKSLGAEHGVWRWHTEREALESHHIICRRLHAGHSLDDL